MDKVFIVEDDDNIRELIVYALNSSEFKAEGFENATQLYEKLEKVTPDLFILDIMLEGEDGYDILEHIRETSETETTPVIMLTAKTAEYDKVRGLDMGADDYVTKPFGVMELISRIKAVLRRTKSEEKDDTIATYKNIEIDTEKRQVEVDGEVIDLTYKEYELLYFLVVNQEIVLSRDKIMNGVWGFDYQGESRTVDVHIRTLRQKLKGAGKHIKTVRNVGYKIGE